MHVLWKAVEIYSYQSLHVSEQKPITTTFITKYSKLIRFRRLNEMLFHNLQDTFDSCLLTKIIILQVIEEYTICIVF